MSESIDQAWIGNESIDQARIGCESNLARRAVIGLGANLGDPQAALRGAVEAFAASRDVSVLACSRTYRTDPVGGPQQPKYLNAVLIIRTDLDPDALLDLAHRIEQEWGRQRRERWGPRTLDIDLIDVDGLVLDSERLTLPHPRAHERAFVLVPWAQVDPDAVIAGAGAIRELLADLDRTGVQDTGCGLLDDVSGEPG